MVKYVRIYLELYNFGGGMKYKIVTVLKDIYEDFIVNAYNVINNSNGQQINDFFFQNFVQDFKNEKVKILILEDDDVPIGLCIYSRVYWVGDRDVLWISQLYVEPMYRKHKLGKYMLTKICEYENCNLVALATSEENSNMNYFLSKNNFKEINLKMFFAENLKMFGEKNESI